MSPTAAGSRALLLLVALGGGCGRDKDSGDAGPAAVLFEDATFYLGGGETTDALAVQGGVVVAIGADARARGAEQTVSLGGAFVAPGFQDAHTHLLPGSFVMERLVTLGTSSMSSLLGSLGDYAEEHPEEPWLIGFGWVSALMDRPDGRLIDDVVSDRPVLLVDSSGHNALINSAAMAAVGITAETPDPAGGTIVRDPKTGAPTGLLQEEALALVSPVAIGAYTDEDFIVGMRKPLEQMRDAGLTSISDVMASPGFDLAFPWIFQQLDEAGELPIRIHFYVPLFSVEDVEAAAALGTQYDGERVRFVGGKVWVDGSSSTAEGWMLDPLEGTADDYGSRYFSAEALAELVARAEAAGLPLKLHVTGDAAVAASLDAMEAVAAAQGGLQQQHVLEHVVLIQPADRARMAELGVVASVQPTHASVASLGSMPDAWGEERFEAAYDLRSLADAGVPMALGTDWPVWPTLDVPVILWAATSLGEHAITAQEALDAYTAGGAQAVGLPGSLGCLAVGCTADMTVLSGDPRAASSAELSQLEVEATYIAGERVP